MISEGYNVRKTQPTIADFENGGRGPRVEENRQPPEAGRAREQSLLQNPQKGMQLSQHLEFSSTRPVSDFRPTEF